MDVIVHSMLYPRLPVDKGNTPVVVPCIHGSLGYNSFVF